jgi:hypothetical protein
MKAAAAAELDRKAAEGQATAPPPGTYTDEQLESVNPILAKRREDLADATSMHGKLVFWNDLVVNVKTFLPKTGETIWVLKRALITDEEIKRFRVEMANAPRPERRDQKKDPERKGYNEDEDRAHREDVGNAVEDAFSSRSIAWVIGTSLGFEAVILGFAAWRFRRRDF